jgi:hypothetical protein
MHHALYVAVREQEGREPSPTVAIIDSQTAQGAQKGVILRATTGQEDQRRKRRILVDTPGLVVNVVVHPADIHRRTHRTIRSNYPGSAAQSVATRAAWPARLAANLNGRASTSLIDYWDAAHCGASAHRLRVTFFLTQ